jgi:hypothetical protein
MNFMIYIFPLELLQVGSPYALKAECDVKINDPVMLGIWNLAWKQIINIHTSHIKSVWKLMNTSCQQ